MWKCVKCKQAVEKVRCILRIYLTKWYNYKISYQGENLYVREKKSTRTVILLLQYGRYDSQKPYFKTHQ